MFLFKLTFFIFLVFSKVELIDPCGLLQSKVFLTWMEGKLYSFRELIGSAYDILLRVTH